MPTKSKKTAKAKEGNGRKVINLALQGGGAHGAFTWGVLDALLEDDRVDIEGIAATSAGAMNAAVMAQGLNNGGVKAARKLLNEFWERVAQAGAFYSPVCGAASGWANMVAPWTESIEQSLSYGAFEMMTNFLSPYQFNPANLHPLRPILEDMLTIPQLRSDCSIKLCVSATAVRTGTGHIFYNADLSIDALLASAALPTMFQAVKIGKDYYWDGGYAGNPPLWPLFSRAVSRDILIVHVNPIVRDELPDRASSIDNRLNEITFNASLLDELRAISFVKRLIRENWLRDEYRDRMKDILIHAIRADRVLKDLSVASKFDTDWDFLTRLRDLGRAEGAAWVDAHYDSLGVEDTVDIVKEYLEIGAGE